MTLGLTRTRLLPTLNAKFECVDRLRLLDGALVGELWVNAVLVAARETLGISIGNREFPIRVIDPVFRNFWGDGRTIVDTLSLTLALIPSGSLLPRGRARAVPTTGLPPGLVPTTGGRRSRTSPSAPGVLVRVTRRSSNFGFHGYRRLGNSRAELVIGVPN